MYSHILIFRSLTQVLPSWDPDRIDDELADNFVGEVFHKSEPGDVIVTRVSSCSRPLVFDSVWQKFWFTHFVSNGIRLQVMAAHLSNHPVCRPVMRH